MLTQRCLLPLLTSTVKSSLFMHVHYSPLSLAARLYLCGTNHSCYIKNGWSFSRRASYTQIEWLNHMVVLFLSFWGNSIVAAPIDIPICSAQKFHFIHILVKPCYLLSFSMTDILRGLRSYLITFWFTFPLLLVMLSTFSHTH